MKISFKRFDLDGRGFSIIELMVVVAMISIMAIIGIPQYKKFVAKARQAEAKIQLSGIFAAEAAFHFEYNGYSSNLRVSQPFDSQRVGLTINAGTKSAACRCPL